MCRGELTCKEVVVEREGVQRAGLYLSGVAWEKVRQNEEEEEEVEEVPM